MAAASPPRAHAADKDCPGFPNQRAAQNYYTSIGGPASDPTAWTPTTTARRATPFPVHAGSSPESEPPSNPAPRPKGHRKRTQTIKARITSVVDGDTIKVKPLERTKRSRYTVRLIGIDTPETKKPGTPIECGGREATSSAWDLSFPTVVDENDDGLYDTARGKGRVVKLVTDPTQDTFDRYDRLLAYVDIRGGPTFAGAQLKRGWAKVYVYRKPFEQLASFRSISSRAKHSQRGAWKLCHGHFHRRAVRPIDHSPTVEYIPAVPPKTDPSEPSPSPSPANCSASYPTVCIPPPPPDLDCGQISPRNFRVVGSDPHRFDNDHDRIGCES